MEFLGNVYVRSAIEFVHDIAAGAFPGAVLMAWIIRQQIEVTQRGAVADVGRASLSLWVILLGVLFAIGLTGLIRLRYWKLNVRPGFLDSKKRLVLIKHTAFVVLLIASIALTVTVVPQ
jgi:hypothetical protein